MTYYVYFLQSLKDKKFYIGYTSRDPNDRLTEHNNGKVNSTKNRRPFRVIYSEKYTDKKIAMRREWHLKHPQGYQDKLDILNNMGS